MPPVGCTIEGCTEKHSARGLCKRHYRVANPDKPRQAECSGCGIQVSRLSNRRYTTTYCSELCRHWIQWGAWSSTWTHKAPKVPKIVVARVARAIDCEWCGAHAVSTISIQRFCSRTCKLKRGKAARRGLQYGAPGTYTWAQLVHLWVAFEKACAYCRSATPMADIQAEHVHPLSRGGRNDLGNLLPSCGPCNSDKRDLLLPEWNADRQRRHLAPVTTTWRDDDPRYAHLVTALTLAA